VPGQWGRFQELHIGEVSSVVSHEPSVTMFMLFKMVPR
jgi:hypothetical protein